MPRALSRAVPIVLLVLTGCGGGSGPTQPPPPPPPPTPPGPPASITVQAGDGLGAEPGTATATHPAVLIRDASSRPVPGVSVTFSVDSGGGSVSGASVTSGADGIATAGDWKLGTTEGRNTLLVQTGALSVKMSATARFSTTVLADQSVAPGASLTVNQPGSPLNGLRIDVPAAAFAGPVALKVQAGSANGIPHAPEITIGSPLITIESDAAAPAKRLLTLRIPTTIAADEVPLVAIVDPVAGFLDAAPTFDYDGTGVTAYLWSLDEGQYTETQTASLHAAAAVTTLRMRIAVFLMKASLLHTQTFNTGFLPGVDDWDFTAEATSIWDQTNNAGAAVTERYYFTNQKSQVSGPLSGRFDIAKGVPSSNVSGMRWSATVAARFDTLVQPFLNQAVQDRAANPIRYDRNVIQWTAASMFASNGRPQILAFDDPATHIYRTVLARSWDGPAGILRHANPEFPGDLTKLSTWTSNGYVCNTICYAVAYGLNHLIRYAGELNNQWPQVVDNTINQGLGPTGHFESWSPLWTQVKYEIPDTMFMVGDTTRLWSECPACLNSFVLTLPVSHGSSGLQGERAFLLSNTGGTRIPAVGSPGGVPLDRSQLSAAAWVDTKVGFEFRSLRDIATVANPVTRWHGWRTFQVIKYALVIQATSLSSGNPGVVFSLSTNGGPALTNKLIYEFKWGDSKPTAQFVGITSGINHVYDTDGRYTVEVSIKHPSVLDDHGFPAVIGSATLDIDLGGSFINFVIGGAWDPVKTPPNGSYQFTSFTSARIAAPGLPGLDAVLLGYDLTTGGEAGVVLRLFIPTWGAVTQGQVFHHEQVGQNIDPGTFTLLLSSNLSNLADPNSTQTAPVSTGTLTIDSLNQLSNGLFVAQYSFRLVNAAGALITGSGIGSWR